MCFADTTKYEPEDMGSPLFPLSKELAEDADRRCPRKKFRRYGLEILLSARVAAG